MSGYSPRLEILFSLASASVGVVAERSSWAPHNMGSACDRHHERRYSGAARNINFLAAVKGLGKGKQASEAQYGVQSLLDHILRRGMSEDPRAIAPTGEASGSS